MRESIVLKDAMMGEALDHPFNVPRPRKLARLFMACSGARLSILYECPSDWNKFAAMGASVFLVACLAAFSGGYVFYITFGNWWLTIAAAILWGVIIFTIDYSILSSFKKGPGGSSGKMTMVAMFRLLIAIFIAFIVSKPLEMRLFKDTIEKKLTDLTVEEMRSFDTREKRQLDSLNTALTGITKTQSSLEEDYFENSAVFNLKRGDIRETDSSIHMLNQKINENRLIIGKHTHLVTGRQRVLDRATGSYRDTLLRQWLPDQEALVRGRENKELEAKYLQMQRHLTQDKQASDSMLNSAHLTIHNNYTGSMAYVRQVIDSLQQSYGTRKLAALNSSNKSRDLPARIAALALIGKEDPVIWWAGWLITVLLVLIDTMPVLTKLLSNSGPYDRKIHTVEETIYLQEQAAIRRHKTEEIYLEEEMEKIARLKAEIAYDVEKFQIEAQAELRKELARYYIASATKLGSSQIRAMYQEYEYDNDQKIKAFHRRVRMANDPTFTDIFWAQDSSEGRMEYFFRDSSRREKELFHKRKDGKLVKGTWMYNENNLELVLKLGSKTSYFLILSINETSLRMKDQTTQKIVELRNTGSVEDSGAEEVRLMEPRKP